MQGGNFLDATLQAFTRSTADFVQPAVGSSVVVPVQASGFMPAGLPVFIEGGGTYTVISSPSRTLVRLLNVGDSAGAVAGVVVPSGRLLCPGGISPGALVLHGDQQRSDGIHGAVAFSYASATARRAAVLTSLDVDKIARQTDTTPPTRWIVDSVSGGVGTWSQINTTAESVLSWVGAILGAEPAWMIDGTLSTIVDAGSSLASSASDASGHGYDATFTSTHRPLIVASGLNGKKTLRFTSSQYGGNTAFAAPAPGTTPIYTFMVVKSATAASNSVFLGTGANNIYVGTGPVIADYNGNTGPYSGTVTAGTWYIVELLRTNSSTDYSQLNGSGGTVGTTAGNTANTGYMLNATSAGAQGNDIEMATMFQWVGTPPDSTKRTALRAAAHSIWGSF